MQAVEPPPLIIRTTGIAVVAAADQLSFVKRMNWSLPAAVVAAVPHGHGCSGVKAIPEGPAVVLPARMDIRNMMESMLMAAEEETRILQVPAAKSMEDLVTGLTAAPSN